MTGYDRGWLAQITSAEKYVRRCNGRDDEVRLVTGANLRAVLAVSENVQVDSKGIITWRGPAGLFSAEPVRDQQAEDRP